MTRSALLEAGEVVSFAKEWAAPSPAHTTPATGWSCSPIKEWSLFRRRALSPPGPRSGQPRLLLPTLTPLLFPSSPIILTR